MLKPLVPCLAILIFTMVAGGQSEDDPYSISIVRGALTLRSAGKQVMLSSTQKNLLRLGDGVSIALLKALNEQDLANPQTVRDFLPIIRDSFSHPELISLDMNKMPQVTLFLLGHLLRESADTAEREEIQQTIDYVRAHAPSAASP